MAWSRFEERVIRDMADLFPGLAERLIALLYWIVDLLPIVADNVAHPDFQGYSMKAVAPALAPEVTYGDLDIGDGGEASAAFYGIVADPMLGPVARDGLRQSLLKYCERDTLALARVHQWLMRGGTFDSRLMRQVNGGSHDVFYHCSYVLVFIKCFFHFDKDFAHVLIHFYFCPPLCNDSAPDLQ